MIQECLPYINAVLHGTSHAKPNQDRVKTIAAQQVLGGKYMQGDVLEPTERDVTIHFINSNWGSGAGWALQRHLA